VYVTQNSANSTLALTGTNTYTGWTTITAGVLRASPGAGLSANSCLLLSGGVLETSGTFARDINNNYRKVYWAGNGGFAAYGGDLAVTLNGGGTIDWGNNPQGFAGKTLILGSATATDKVTVTNNIDLKGGRTVQVNNNTGSLADIAEFSGILADGGTAGGLTKTGNGVLILSGANTYSGTTTVSAGTLQITGSNSGGGGTTVSGTGILQLTSGTLASGTLALNGGMIEAYGTARSVANTITWGGNFTLGGTQDLNLTSTTAVATGARTITVSNTGVTTMSAPWTYSGNCTFAFGNGSGNVVLDGTVQLNAGDRTFTVNATGTAGSLVINGAVTQDVAGRQLIKAGTGTMVLTGASSYTGTTTINGGGALRVDADAGNLGTGNLTLGSGVLETSGSFTRSTGTAAGNVQWTGAVAAGFAAKGGNLTITLNNNAATERIWTQNNFVQNNQPLLLGSGAADAMVELVNPIALANTTTGNATRTIQVDDNPGSAADFARLSGVIRDATGTGTNNAITKTGAGLLELTNVNTYTGATTVNAGTLKVTGSIDSSAVTVSNPGTVLAGDGSVKSLAMDANTILAPGDSVGDLGVVAGDCSLAAGTVYQWEFGSGGNDVVNITAGNLTLTNGWILKLVDAGGTPDSGTPYNLFTYSGTPSLGTYIIDDSAVDWDVTGASIDAAGGFVYITGLAEPPGIGLSQAIPEPCTAMLLVFGAAAMLRRRRVADAA
jgi:autotransporter-associated beta strand protein